MLSKSDTSISLFHSPVALKSMYSDASKVKSLVSVTISLTWINDPSLSHVPVVSAPIPSHLLPLYSM